MRTFTVVAAGIGAILSVFSIYATARALVKFRAADLLDATSIQDFERYGTCVETLTKDQLQSLKYDKLDLKCEDDPDAGNRLRVRNSLMVSVHGLYYAYFRAGMTYATVERVLGSLALAVASSDGAVPFGINMTDAYEALLAVSEAKVPKTCELIYDKDIGNLDSADWTYIKNVRLGRLDDDDRVKTTWPMQQPVINCNGATRTAGTESTLTDDAALTKLLYAHCRAQFTYASVGTQLNAGTFGVPLPGEVSGPMPNYFYPNPKGYNSSLDYTAKARLHIGQRFGYSLWAYIPMLLTSCYLAAGASRILNVAIASTKLPLAS